MNSAVLVRRNARRVARLRAASRDLTPGLRTIVVTCADHRVDPAHVLGLRAGEAIVLRNPGGRVTADVLRSLLVLSTVATLERIDGGFEIVVMHHTDCGLSRLTGSEHAALVAEYAGVAVDDVPQLAIADPWRAVIHDTRLLSKFVAAPDTSISALVYDLATGRVERFNSAS
jgi:carbonic anhydrase